MRILGNSLPHIEVAVGFLHPNFSTPANRGQWAVWIVIPRHSRDAIHNRPKHVRTPIPVILHCDLWFDYIVAQRIKDRRHTVRLGTQDHCPVTLDPNPPVDSIQDLPRHGQMALTILGNYSLSQIWSTALDLDWSRNDRQQILHDKCSAHSCGGIPPPLEEHILCWFQHRVALHLICGQNPVYVPVRGGS